MTRGKYLFFFLIIILNLQTLGRRSILVQKYLRINESVFLETYERQMNYINFTSNIAFEFFIGCDNETIVCEKSSSFYCQKLYFYSKDSGSFDIINDMNYHKNLRVLILTNVGLTKLNFTLPFYLVYVDFSNNKINYVDHQFAKYLPLLRYLDLSNNQLISISFHFSFIANNFLMLEIRLENNYLQSFELTANENIKDYFYYFSIYNNNELKSIKKDKHFSYFKLIYDFGTFNLTISRGYFSFLDNRFDLSYWPRVEHFIEGTLKIDHQKMNMKEHISYERINLLKQLNLAWNQIRMLRKSQKATYPQSIMLISLQNNFIEYIDRGFFDNCPNLKKIDLSFNKLYSISNFELKILTLNYLELNNNQMDSLEYLVLNSTDDLQYLSINLNFNRLTKIPVIKCKVHTITKLSLENQQTSKFNTLYMNFNGIKNSNRNPIIKELTLSNNFHLKNIHNEIFCFLGHQNWNNLKIKIINLTNTSIDLQRINCLKQFQIGINSDLNISFGKIKFAHNKSACQYNQDTDCELHGKRVEELMMINKKNRNILDAILIGLILLDSILSVILIKILCFS